MSTIREIIVEYPFIGKLLVNVESLKRTKLLFTKVSGEMKELVLLTPEPFEKLQKIAMSCLAKFIKFDLLNNTAYFEFGLKGGGPYTSKSNFELNFKPISSKIISNQKNSIEKYPYEETISTGFANIVWIDTNIFNDENQAYFESAPSNFFIKRISSISDGIAYINSYKRKKIVVVVSGSLGKELLSKIKLEYILTIIIFCSNLEYHKSWTINYQIISHVINDFDDAIRIIQKEYLWITENAKHVQYTSSAYKSLYNLVNGVINSDMVNKISITDELAYLNMEKKEKIKQILDNEKHVLAEAIIYLYTTNCIYKEFNMAFKNDELHKVILSSSLCLKDIMYQKKYNFTGEYLYRGIRGSDLSEYQKALEKSIPIFFPGFLSATQSKLVARDFAGDNGIIFKIKLNSDKPYPHVKLTEGMSHFDNEQEVVLMSHIPLYVTGIKEDKLIVLLKQFSYIKVTFLLLCSKLYLEFEDFLLVKDVKKIVKEKIGIPIQYQIFRYKYRILENDKSFKCYIENSYDINILIEHENYKHNNYLVYLKALKISQIEYLLKGKDRYGKIIEINMGAQNPLSEIKRILAEKYENVIQGELFYKDTIVSENDTLEHLQINSKSIVLLYSEKVQGMKIFLRDPTGKTTILDVHPLDLVKSVKMQIQNKLAIPVDKQRLIISPGKQLEDGRILADYKIEKDSMLHLILRPGGGMQIFIRAPTGKINALDVGPSDSIEAIKEKYYIKENIMPDQIMLHFGEELLMDGKTLADYNISNEFLLHVVPKFKKYYKLIKIISGKKEILLYIDSAFSIEEIKRYIESIEKIPSNQQRLFFSGKELMDGTILRDYDTLKANEYILLILNDREIQIILKFLTCKELFIAVVFSDSIKSIKDKFETIKQIPTSLQKLFYKGKELENERLLSDYNINDQSKLYVKCPIYKNLISKNKFCIDNINSLDEIFESYFHLSKITENSFPSILKKNDSENIYYEALDPESDQFNIFITFFTGNVISVNISNNEKIIDIKQKIQKIANIPCNEQILVQLCYELIDDETVLSAGVEKNSNLYLIPLFKFEKTSKGIKAWLNKHHIGNIINLRKLLNFEGLDLSLKSKIYFEGLLINDLDELPNSLCLIFIEDNADSESYSNCDKCIQKSNNIVLYNGMKYCKTHIKPLLKSCDSCGKKCLTAEFIKLKNRTLCKICGNNILPNLVFINSISNQDSLILYKICDDYIIYQTNNSVFIIQNVYDHLNIIREINIKNVSIACVSKDKKLILFINSGILYAKSIHDDGYVLEENHECFKDTSLMISAGNTLVVVTKSLILNIFTFFPFSYKFEFTENEKAIKCIELASNDKYLFSSSDKIIKMWSLENRRFQTDLKGHKCEIICMKVNKTNEILVSGSADRFIIVWNIATASMIHKFQAHKMEIRGIAISDDNKYIISGGQDWCLNVWSLDSYELVTRVVEKSWVSFVEISSDSKYVYTGLSNGTMNCYALRVLRI